MTIAPPPMTDRAPTDATAVFGRRILAWTLDLAFFLGVVVALFAAQAEYVDIPAGVDDVSACAEIERLTDVGSCVVWGDRAYLQSDADIGLQTLASVGYFAFFVLIQGASGASPGKHVLGLRVVDADGNRAGVGRSLARTLAWAIDAAPWLVPFVGAIVALTTSGHRRVGDMIAGTYVINRSFLGMPVRPDQASLPPQSVAWGAPPTDLSDLSARPAAPGVPTPSGPLSPAPWPQPSGPPTARRSTPRPDPDPRRPATEEPWTAATEPHRGVFDDAVPEDQPSEPDPAVGRGRSPDEPAAWADPPEWTEPRAWSEPASWSTTPGTEAAETPPPIPSAPDEPVADFGADFAPRPPGFVPPGASHELISESVPERGPDRVPAPPPQWDAARNTYLQWDPNRQAWLQWDAAGERWVALDS